VELDLSETSDPPEQGELEEGRNVRLYSKQLDCEIELEITHLEPEPGGIVCSDVSTPHLHSGDHVHFRSENVLKFLD